MVPEDRHLSDQSHGRREGFAAARRIRRSAPRLFAAFTEAKAAFLARLASAKDLSAEEQALARRRTVVGDDPLPYGFARNRRAMEAVIQFAAAQKILPRPVAPEDMFARNTLDL